MSLLLLNVKDTIKISLCSSSLIYLQKVDIASERDVLTEYLSNVSTLERLIDALTSWFDNLSGKDQKLILLIPILCCYRTRQLCSLFRKSL